MNPTELQAVVERLAEQVADQRERPADKAGWISAGLALRDALDQIRYAIDDLDDDLDRRIAATGAVTKRCARDECRRWMLVTNGVGRRRRTCSAACRVALARSR